MDTSVVRPLTNSKNMRILVGAGVIVTLAGILVGYIAASKKAVTSSSAVAGSSTTVTDKEAGMKDASSFKDTATGVLKEGGLKGEGSFHLERPGGTSQNVYLTSTVIDMAPFLNKKVQIWGETQAGKHAGWFMDVGKIKVIE